MTVEEIVLAAFARTMEIGNVRPSARAIMYRRIGLRQQQLFTIASRVNPDWAGTSAVGALTDGALDLGDVIDPIETLERVTRILIEDAGPSGWAVGTEVSVVPLDDAAAFDPPRVTIRSNALAPVDEDLDGVASLRLYYTRVPRTITPADENLAVEIVGGHEELLVVDLTRDLVRKSIDVQGRDAIVKMLTDEEAGLLEGFVRHVSEYASMQRRFGAPADTPHPKAAP